MAVVSRVRVTGSDTCYKRRPGPSAKIKTTARVPEAAIQTQLRAISAGRAVVPLGIEPPLSHCAIHASPDVPPNDAAAAEIATNSMPTGLNKPAMHESVPPARYGKTVSRTARCLRCGKSVPINGRSLTTPDVAAAAAENVVALPRYSQDLGDRKFGDARPARQSAESAAAMSS